MKIKEEIIKVKFLNPKINKYGRPRRIYKITTDRKIKYSVAKDGGEHVDKEKQEVYYTHKIKNSCKKLDSNIFKVVEKKGITPTPKPLYKYNDEELKKMGYNYEGINNIIRRKYRAKDVKILSNKLKINNSRAREILDKHDGSIYKAMIGVDPKERRVNTEINRCKKKFKKHINSVREKDGTITVIYKDHKESFTKHFPAKGILDNSAFKDLKEKDKNFDEFTITDVIFKYKKGAKDAEAKRLNKLRLENKAKKLEIKKKKKLEKRKLKEQKDRVKK